MDIDLRKARKAAVLILLFADPVVKTVLIQRQAYDGIHSNQVSFPGGKYETSDGTLKHTALRETCEEIGIRRLVAMPIAKYTIEAQEAQEANRRKFR